MKIWFEMFGCLVLLAVLFYAFTLNGCEAEDIDALNAIRGQGLTEPTLYGNDLYACKENESSRKFSAKNHAGELVHGTVCCEMYRGTCTIRWSK